MRQVVYKMSFCTMFRADAFVYTVSFHFINHIYSEHFRTMQIDRYRTISNTNYVFPRKHELLGFLGAAAIKVL